MKPPVTLRPLRSEDAPVLAAIDAVSNNPAWSARQFLQELDLPQSAALVAESEAKAVGFAIFWSVAGTAQILQVAVHPDHRRRGTGEALLRGLMDAARAKGCGKMELELRRENAAALSLYEKLGFKAVGSRKNFYGDADGILMECVL